MKKAVFIVLISLLGLTNCANSVAISSSELNFTDFTNSTQLHDTNVFHFYWKIIEEPTDTSPGKIRIGINSANKGWVGMGFNSNPGMFGADLIYGTKDGSNFIIKDMHNHVKPFQPEEDKNQNSDIISAYQSDTKTQMIFERPIQICDGNNEDLYNEASLLYVLYAWGE